MSLAYVVRCNFANAELEQAWNDWYSGPKLRQMLEKPHFETGQRFRRYDGRGRDYLAFWTLASAEAFETPEYRNDWGFFEWKPHITDWSRDLFKGADRPVQAPEVPAGYALRLVSFEGMSRDEAQLARERIDRDRPGTAWLEVVGLDRHTPFLGVSVDERSVAKAKTASLPGVQEAFYEPISTLLRRTGSTRPEAR